MGGERGGVTRVKTALPSLGNAGKRRRRNVCTQLEHV